MPTVPKADGECQAKLEGQRRGMGGAVERHRWRRRKVLSRAMFARLRRHILNDGLIVYGERRV